MNSSSPETTSMITREGLKVFSAAILGFSAPGLNWVVEVGEPMVKLLVLLGQFGVAVVTILYIFRKWKCAGKKTRRSKNPRTTHDS